MSGNGDGTFVPAEVPHPTAPELQRVTAKGVQALYNQATPADDILEQKEAEMLRKHPPFVSRHDKHAFLDYTRPVTPLPVDVQQSARLPEPAAAIAFRQQPAAA
jgi:hypothetical protein